MSAQAIPSKDDTPAVVGQDTRYGHRVCFFIRHSSSAKLDVKERDMRKDNPYVGAVGRLLIAAIFLISGLGKITTPAQTQGFIASAGLPFPVLAYLVAVLIEVGGGILLVLGYQSRIIASVMALFTVATAFSFHSNFGDPNAMAHFLKNIAITGGLLQIVAFGAGTFSIDGRVREGRL
jgi:putative oxidoreductase